MLLVANERGHANTQTDHVHLNADPNNHARAWRLSGCANIPNLLDINIECCPSTIRGLFGYESWGHAKFREIHDLGDRSISATVVIEDLRRLNWQESTLCLGDPSYLDELWLHSSNNRCSSPLLTEAEQLRKDATHRTRLHKLRRLNVEGKLSYKRLSFILRLCPEIERLNLDLYPLYHNNLLILDKLVRFRRSQIEVRKNQNGEVRLAAVPASLPKSRFALRRTSRYPLLWPGARWIEEAGRAARVPHYPHA